MSGKDHPIIFSGPMVRALLDGRKTQTRRLAWGKPMPGLYESGGGALVPIPRRSLWQRVKPGDRLYVRENFKELAAGEIKNRYGEVRYGHGYQADGATVWAERPTIIHDLTDQPNDTGPMQFQERPWRPSIHMPRRFSRIMLAVTATKIERLQAISTADAIAEGLAGDLASSWEEGYRLGSEDGWADWIERDAILYSHPNPHGDDFNELTDDPRRAYRWPWESLHGESSWADNPEVVALTFTVHKQNIDSLPKSEAA